MKSKITIVHIYIKWHCQSQAGNGGNGKKTKILNLAYWVKAYPLDIILNPKLSVRIISFVKKLEKTLLATVPSCAAAKKYFWPLLQESWA